MWVIDLSLATLFDLVSERLRIEFDYQAKILGHPGEIGTGRENVLKSILTKYIPKRYAVDSGFVIDTSIGKSEQMDIVIYEANHTPVFEVVDGKKFFPCETVVAVGQVRTKIGSRKVFQKCLNNIKSVKQLDRSNRGKNEMITGPGISLEPIAKHFDPRKNFRDQIFGFIFCSSSIKADLMTAELERFNKENQPTLWTNLIVNYRNFLIEYENEHLTQNPMEARKIALTDPSEKPRILAIFISILNNFLNIAHIARPVIFDYCNIGEVLHHDFPL